MSNELRCPFCDGVLIELDHLVCSNCEFHVFLDNETARFSSKAASHMKETVRFIDKCSMLNPQFCLSKVGMWEPGFLASDVIVCGAEFDDYALNVFGGFLLQEMGVSLPSNKNKNVIADGYRLIAARGKYSADMKYDFLRSYRGNWQYGFAESPYRPAEEYLYQKFHYYNKYRTMSDSETIMMNAFYSPNLETLLYHYTNIFDDVVHFDDLNGEQMLYTYAFAMDKMPYDTDVEQYFSDKLYNVFYKSVRDYMPAVSSMDFSSVWLFTPTEEDIEELSRLCMCSDPDCAVNGVNLYHGSFDISTWSVVKYPTLDTALSKYYHQALLWQLKVKSDLFNKYAGYSKELGIKFKESIVGHNSDDNITVIKFWEHIIKKYDKNIPYTTLM